MKVKLATKKDVEDLEFLSRLASRERKGWTFQSKAEFKRIINKKDEGVLLVRIDRAPAGYLHYEYVKSKRRLWIEQVFVAKKFRKGSVAKSLVKKAIAKWIRVKHLSVVLLTSDQNLRIFNRLGFDKTMNYMEFKKKRR